MGFESPTAGSNGPRPFPLSNWPEGQEFLPPVIYEIAVSLFPVDDDLIHKANGWLLREAGKADPQRLGEASSS